jgi:protein O-GlcNAc transferase
MIEVEDISDAAAAAAIRELEIDIAVDLNGHAGAGRAGILAQRPAPVQVNYLGNAGTTGAPFLDYIIADRTVLPRAHFPYYTEQVVYLPHSYQCNDSRRGRPRTTLSRYDAGLPETGFVYCCFNNLYKISPEIFDVWMRLLRAIPGAVLWLLGEDRFAIHNLRREAGARGIAPVRLVFAPRAPLDDHLARHALADLFLDTLPTNAHATASDALWAGLPLLTCLGNSFGGRVAGSLLRAVGLPELAAESLTEYEELALTLARVPGRLAAIRATLERNRDTEPLFDTPRYTGDLESAYIAMCRRQRAGLPSKHIDLAGPMDGFEQDEATGESVITSC